MRVFLDANILFSGVRRHSRMEAFLAIVFKRAAGLTNAFAAEEARRNLAAKSPTDLPALDALLRRCETAPTVTMELPVALKEKDRPILSGAIAGRATHLLTGDQTDFGHLFGQTVLRVRVVSPRLLATEFVARGWLEVG